MQFQLQQAKEILRNTPSVVRSMLTGLSDDWIHNDYGPETFSPFDVVGHLIHGDRQDWITRAKIILEHGKARNFDPFDRHAMHEESRRKSITDLLDEFETIRQQKLEELDELAISDEQLSLKGSHPALGEVTLKQLLSTWVAHDLNHIHQIAKCLAWQYKENIGPWREYITFVDR